MSDKHQQRHERKARQARAKAQHSRDNARRKLLRQRENLARRRKRNREQSEARRNEADESGDGVENPAAHSTVPPQKTNAENAVRNSHSAVPSTPKYSAAPGRERLYGQRLHQRTTSEPAGSAGTSDTTTTPLDRSTNEDQTNE
ncbi:protein gvpI [Halobellus salinus]|uniref:Protein gvpI n=1 Tax=Halobellus salinus TaxID=931585 RepID=A0A830EAE3_9EURY|nr:protein gvpI [Halobellus salinus]GGJ05378.1 protein gvpI [Halobellus salinus]